MGFMDKVARGLLGMGPVERAAERLVQEAGALADRGLPEFTLAFTQSDIGVRNTLSGVTPMMVDRLQDAGFGVTGVSGGNDWSYTVTLTVVAPARRATSAASRPSGPADPAATTLHRGLAAVQAEPEGSLGDTMTTSELSELAVWMRATLEAEDPRAVWEKRLALGYGVDTNGLSQQDGFWINCAPALAALRMGKRDHPFIATCCGLAGDSLNRSDPEQAAAFAEVERLFFG